MSEFALKEKNASILLESEGQPITLSWENIDVFTPGSKDSLIGKAFCCIKEIPPKQIINNGMIITRFFYLNVHQLRIRKIGIFSERNCKAWLVGGYNGMSNCDFYAVNIWRKEALFWWMETKTTKGGKWSWKNNFAQRAEFPEQRQSENQRRRQDKWRGDQINEWSGQRVWLCAARRFVSGSFESQRTIEISSTLLYLFSNLTLYNVVDSIWLNNRQLWEWVDWSTMHRRANASKKSSMM